jgi:hypothetical protein
MQIPRHSNIPWDPFEVSADGKRFLVNSVDQPQAAEPINVIVNWDTELQK